MTARPLNHLLLAAVLGVGATTAYAATDEQLRNELEAARAELEAARVELEQAARKLAEAHKEVEFETKFEKKFGKDYERTLEYWTNPKRAMLGVIIGPGPVRQKQFYGSTILAVTPGSGADEAGLQAGDLIVEINGEKVREPIGSGRPPEKAVGDILGVLEDGQKVKLAFERDGKLQKTVVMAKRPESFKGDTPFAFNYFLRDGECDEAVIGKHDPMPPLPPSAPRAPRAPRLEMLPRPSGLLGLELAAVNKELGEYFSTDHGVLVVRSPDEGTLGLKAGDVITRVDGRPVSDPRLALEQLRKVAEDQDVTVDVVRKGKRMKLQGTLPPLAWAPEVIRRYEIIREARVATKG